MLKKYTVSQIKETGEYYCHLIGFDYIPVFGSIGSKKKAQAYCNMKNFKPFDKSLVK